MFFLQQHISHTNQGTTPIVHMCKMKMLFSTFVSYVEVVKILCWIFINFHLSLEDEDKKKVPESTAYVPR